MKTVTRLVLIGIGVLIALRARPARAGDDPWFARDKALHAAAGAALGAGGYAASALVFETPRTRVASGLIVGLGAGAAKEWHDRGGRGTPSWRDFAWDGVGTAAGLSVAWLIDRTRRAHRSPPRPAHVQSTRAPGGEGTYRDQVPSLPELHMAAPIPQQ